MNRLLKIISIVLVLAVSSAFVAACGIVNQTAPDNGFPDKSALAYADKLDSYRKTDWTASWIWTKSCSEDSYVAFRKTFSSSAEEKATAYIAAESKYFLWVNGVLTVVDGGVKRGITPYDSFYDSVEIPVKKGKNVLAVLVAFNGRSGDSSINPVLKDEDGDEMSQAGFLFEMKVGKNTVKSDESFKVKRLTEYKNRVLLGKKYPNYPQSSMLAERNVYYDARDSVGKFMDPGFNDRRWENASLVAKPGQLPFGDLYASMTGIVRFDGIKFLDDDNIGKVQTANKTIILSLPKNIQFSAYFELEAEAGKTITFYTDTFEIGNGEYNYSFKDTYITKDGIQSYENYPWRNGEKLIIEAEAGIKFNKIGYRKSEVECLPSGRFESNDELLNTLWRKSADTISVSTRDNFMDCPDRERGPYRGDASVTQASALYSFDPSVLNLIKREILTTVGWTKKDNIIPSRSPSVKPQEIPVQSLAYSISAMDYYMASGDSGTMSVYYETMINYLKVWEMKDNGMPENRNGSWLWIDWGQGVDGEIIQICWYYYALRTLDALASGLSIEKDRDFIRERSALIKDNFRNLYLKDNGFRSGNNPDDRANGLAVLSGLAEKEDYPIVLDVLKTVRQASPFMEKYILESLCVMGGFTEAKNRMLTRYDAMIKSEYSTLSEKFTGLDNSSNHGWSSGPLCIMSKYFAGVKPTKPGYEEYEIAYQDLFSELKTVVPTVKGDIALEVQKHTDRTTLTIKAIDAKGIIHIPYSLGSEISVSEKEARIDGNTVTINKAGTYIVTVS